MMVLLVYIFCFCAMVFDKTNGEVGSLTVAAKQKTLHVYRNELVHVTWILKKKNVRIVRYVLSIGRFKSVSFSQSRHDPMGNITVTKTAVLYSFKQNNGAARNFSLSVSYVPNGAKIGRFDFDYVSVFLEDPPQITDESRRQTSFYSFEEGSTPLVKVYIKYHGRKAHLLKWTFGNFPQKIYRWREMGVTPQQNLSYRMPQLDRAMCGMRLSLDIYFKQQIVTSWSRHIDVKFIPPMVEKVLFTKNNHCYTITWASGVNACGISYMLEFFDKKYQVKYTINSSENNPSRKQNFRVCSMIDKNFYAVIVTAVKDGRYGARHPPVGLSCSGNESDLWTTTLDKGSIPKYKNEGNVDNWTFIKLCDEDKANHNTLNDVHRLKPLYFYLLLGGCGIGCLATMIFVVYYITRKVRKKKKKKNNAFIRSDTMRSNHLYEHVGYSIHYEDPEHITKYASTARVLPSVYQTLQKNGRCQVHQYAN